MAASNRPFTRDVAVIGGCGHIGLPLALTFADTGLRTVIFDINESVVEQIRAGQMPFNEEGAPELLARMLRTDRLEICSTPELLQECRFLVLIVGTPVDEHLNPSFTLIQKALEGCRAHLRDGQILVLRSTVYPGISNHVRRYLAAQGLEHCRRLLPGASRAGL